MKDFEPYDGEWITPDPGMTCNPSAHVGIDALQRRLRDCVQKTEVPAWLRENIRRRISLEYKEHRWPG